MPSLENARLPSLRDKQLAQAAEAQLKAEEEKPKVEKKKKKK